MAPHFPMNSESESEAITSSDGRPSFTDAATYIPQGNDESESDSPYSTTTTTTKQQPPQQQQANQFEQRGRNRLQAGGNESDGEEDRAGGDGGIRKPYVRSRSKTPRGASSRSRSRGPGNKLNANNQSSYVPRTVLPINSESEDPTTSASTSEAEDPSNFTGHVAQNSGSDTDAAGGSLGVSSGGGRQGGRAEGRSQGGGGGRVGGGGGVGGSRSRSRGRVPQYDVVLNSESESDFVEGGDKSEREEAQQSGGARRERIGISLNSESEQE